MKNQYNLEWTKKTLGNQFISSADGDMPLTDATIAKDLAINFGAFSLSLKSEVGVKVYCARRFTMSGSGKNFLGYVLELTLHGDESLYTSLLGRNSLFVCPAKDKKIFKVPNPRSLDLGSVSDVIESRKGDKVKILFNSSFVEDVFFGGKRWKATYQK